MYARERMGLIDERLTRAGLVTKKHGAVFIDTKAATELHAQKEQVLIVEDVCHLDKRKARRGAVRGQTRHILPGIDRFP